MLLSIYYCEYHYSTPLWSVLYTSAFSLNPHWKQSCYVDFTEERKKEEVLRKKRKWIYNFCFWGQNRNNGKGEGLKKKEKTAIKILLRKDVAFTMRNLQCPYFSSFHWKVKDFAFVVCVVYTYSSISIH